MSLAFVFPGQGSQSVGMLRSFADSPVVRATFEEAGDALGQDLWALSENGPAEVMGLTVNTQPLMLTAGVAIYRTWCETGGPAPSVLAGHSLGEYAAWVASGALDFRDALPLVRLRAQAMQDAVPVGEGAMAAVLGLADAEVAAACRDASGDDVVEPVNFNAPGQVVVAGHRTAVERALPLLKARGARRAMVLPVSAPFHSSLLRPAAERLAGALAAVPFRRPAIPVVNNVDVAVVEDAAGIRDALARQACAPVRWVEVVQEMVRRGARSVVECGPGRVLAGLTRRIDESVESAALTDPGAVEQLAAAQRSGGGADAAGR